MTLARIRAYASDAEFAPAYDVQPWREEAACRGADLTVFFPLGEKGEVSYVEARSYCDACPVLDECRDEAMAVPNYHGFIAGMSPRDRRKALAAQGGRRHASECRFCLVAFISQRPSRVCSSIDCRRAQHREIVNRTRKHDPELLAVYQERKKK